MRLPDLSSTFHLASVPIRTYFNRRLCQIQCFHTLRSNLPVSGRLCLFAVPPAVSYLFDLQMSCRQTKDPPLFLLNLG